MSVVLVVGSVNVDLVIRVAKLPQPGETVTGGTFTQALGGKGANQAAAAAKLGAEVWLVGLTGDDELGREARADLAATGIRLTALGTSPSPTGVAQIVVDDAGENVIAVASGANHDLTGDIVAARLMDVPADDAVVLANLEVPDAAVTAAALVAAERGWRFVLNPAPARDLSLELIGACDVVTPNQHEAVALGGAEHLLALGAGAVVVTRGADGADVLRPRAAPLHVVAHPVEVVDTTGAGDAFNGALVWALATGRGLADAVRLAVAAGGLACRTLGARTGLPDLGQLERAAATLPAD